MVVKENSMSINKTDIIAAHKYSSNHRRQLAKDKKCGCFYCVKVFAPKEIKFWLKETDDETAFCPYCGIDSVIGESSGYTITEAFLQAMNEYWF